MFRLLWGLERLARACCLHFERWNRFREGLNKELEMDIRRY
jgi:hypothetical protein